MHISCKNEWQIIASSGLNTSVFKMSKLTFCVFLPISMYFYVFYAIPPIFPSVHIASLSLPVVFPFFSLLL